MKIVLLGIPGAGKTTLAKKMANELSIPHIEADQIFWSGKDLRSEVSKLIQENSWIYEGHISKVSDLVLPLADKVIHLDTPEIECLLRVIRRDFRNPRKLFFVLKNFYLIRDRIQLLKPHCD